MKFFLSAFLALFFIAHTCMGQGNDLKDFKDFQFSFSRVSQAYARYNDTLRKLFTTRYLKYPPHNIYFRDFKSVNELELWARDDDSSKYELVKIYHICSRSGQLGPKRMEGDKQVPEGLYFIDDFNPKSEYYLSMLLNYPNYSDMICATNNTPGGDVYIHGSCVTVGCLPMTDNIIQEIYTLCLNAKLNGQNYIPVQIYPTRMDKRGVAYLKSAFPSDTTKLNFWNNLKVGYDYFEKHHKLLPVMYTPDGRYAF